MTDADATLAEVARLLAEHRRRARRNGVMMPAELAEALLLATEGLQRPDVAGPSTVDQPLLVDYEGAARMLGTSVRTVRRLAAAGTLPMVRCGGPRIRTTDLRAYVESLPARRVS